MSTDQGMIQITTDIMADIATDLINQIGATWENTLVGKLLSAAGMPVPELSLFREIIVHSFQLFFEENPQYQYKEILEFLKNPTTLEHLAKQLFNFIQIDHAKLQDLLDTHKSTDPSSPRLLTSEYNAQVIASTFINSYQRTLYHQLHVPEIRFLYQVTILNQATQDRLVIDDSQVKDTAKRIRSLIDTQIVALNKVIENQTEIGKYILANADAVLIGNPEGILQATSSEPKASTFMFDVFLSHNSRDKPTVELLASQLESNGINLWLDKWNLIPGEPWQEALEDALDICQTYAIFVGPSGISPWENEEMRSALETRANDKSRRVIPVLLPGVPDLVHKQIPRFLRRLTWVDFRAGIGDVIAFQRLLAGIRGVAPGRL